MEEITLQKLLEAGCHFGHKSERWHPRASEFIYTKKDGIHIIDLAKTKSGLDTAVKFVRETVAAGGEIVFVATKRQARGIVKEIAAKAGAPYFVERWIGGFLTNWDAIKKNLDKAVRMDADRESGAWKKYVKHEQTQMTRILEKLQVYYSGVLKLKKPPQALFVIDVKKENAAIREALRIGIPIIGVVDTNSNPININYVIPANDDAVGSITLISQYIADAYAEGLKMRQDNQETPVASRTEKPVAVVLPAGKTEKLIPENKNEKVTLSVSAVTKDTGKTNQKKTEVKNPTGEISVAVKKRGRPKKNL